MLAIMPLVPTDEETLHTTEVQSGRGGEEGSVVDGPRLRSVPRQGMKAGDVCRNPERFSKIVFVNQPKHF